MQDEHSTRWVKQPIEFIVRPEEHGQRLDRILRNRLKGYSRQTVLDLIGRHNQEQDTNRLKPGKRYRAGDRFHVRLIREIKHYPDRSAELTIRYEDEALLVVEKDGNTPVHGGGQRIGSLVDTLHRHGYTPIWPVHRLDRETSGLVLFAKSRAIAGLLGAQWSGGVTAHQDEQAEARPIQKAYLALVHRVPVPPEGEIAFPVGPCPGHKIRTKQGFLPCDRGGKEARTLYRVMLAFDRHALLRVWPVTGRMHQIRVHLWHLGHPVVGDKLYGIEEGVYLRFIDGKLTEDDCAALMADSHLLHAEALELDHPGTGERLVLRSRLPASWHPVLEQVSGLPVDALRGRIRPEDFLDVTPSTV